MKTTKSITLCADDFAQNEAISEGILDLIQASRLSATSCMTDSPLWPEWGSKLISFRKKIDIGLHFNLTHPFGNQEKPLPYWIVKSLLKRIDKKDIEERLNRQLHQFREIMGCDPDYIDGHQHVHGINGISDIIIKTAKALSSQIYVRNVIPFYGVTDNLFKRFLIKLCCRNFIETGVKTNTSFAGDYSLQPRANYKKMLYGWLRQSPQNSLIMCHPGLDSQNTTDPIRHVRHREYQVLMSGDFLDFIQKEKIKLTKFL